MVFAPSVEVLREELPKALTAAALSTTGKVKNVVHIVLPSAALNGQAPSGAASPSRRRSTSEEVSADDAAILLELAAFVQVRCSFLFPLFFCLLPFFFFCLLTYSFLLFAASCRGTRRR